MAPGSYGLINGFSKAHVRTWPIGLVVVEFILVIRSEYASGNIMLTANKPDAKDKDTTIPKAK